MDVSVVTDYQMSKTWDIKVSKYKQPDISDIQCWAAFTPSVSVQHLPVISNRGLFYELSGMGLRTLGLRCRVIVDLCLLTITSSLECYDLYMRGTGNWWTRDL